MSNFIFPLKLSCGHLATMFCECEKSYGYTSTGDTPIDLALNAYNGRWRETLESYGCKLPYRKTHGGCPVCGGKDRFRFDDKQGRGTWYCSQCEPNSGGGLLLLARYLGKPTIEVAKELIGDENSKRTVAPVRTYVDEDAKRKADMKSAKIGAKNLLGASMLASHPYMEKKGLTGQYPVNSQVMLARGGERIHPGHILIVPIWKGGQLVNAQKITAGGTKRFITGGELTGASHFIQGKKDDSKVIAVVEGYATGVTVNLMTGYQVYVAFSTANLKPVSAAIRESNPEAKIIFFADNDPLDKVHKWNPGKKYAEEAAVIVNGKIALPPEIGDWDDYRQKHGEQECKAAMRLAIKLDGKEEIKHEPEPEPELKPLEDAPTIYPILLPGNAVIEEKQMPAPGEGHLPSGMNFDDLNVDQPPGLAGRIVDYIRNGAYCELKGGAYSAMALQCMAMAGAGIKGFQGAKTSLITIVLALSSAGKERAQGVVIDLLSNAGRMLYGDIRSDKDLIRSAVFDDGRCFYVVDEAHKLLVSNSKNANQYTAAIPALIMEMFTKPKFILSRIHAEEFAERTMTQMSRLAKELDATEQSVMMCNPDHEKQKISELEKRISFLRAEQGRCERALERIRHGVTNPSMNLAASSTPHKLASIINRDNIESGFLGRGLIFDCGEQRELLSKDMYGVDPSTIGQLDKAQLEREIALIVEMSDVATSCAVSREFTGAQPVKVQPSKEADEHLKAIFMHYGRQHRYRNHQVLGALYSRVFERVSSIASIMAFGNVIDGVAVIDESYVRFALMLTLSSIEHLSSNLKMNEAEAAESAESILEGIKEKIMRKLEGGAELKSALKRDIARTSYYKEISKRLVGTGQDAFTNALISLEMSGMIKTVGAKIVKA